MGACISSKVANDNTSGLEREQPINNNAQIRPLNLPVVYPKLPTMSTKPCLFVVRESSMLLEDSIKSPISQSGHFI